MTLGTLGPGLKIRLMNSQVGLNKNGMMMAGKLWTVGLAMLAGVLLSKARPLSLRNLRLVVRHRKPPFRQELLL